MDETIQMYKISLSATKYYIFHESGRPAGDPQMLICQSKIVLKSKFKNKTSSCRFSAEY